MISASKKVLFAVILALGLFACASVLGFDDLRAPDDTDGGDAQAANGPAAASVTLNATGGTPFQFGREIAFTAVVAGNKGAPTGNVTFTDGATTLGTLALVPGAVAGTATVSTTTLSAGSHTITATYGGDTTYPSGAAGSTVVNIAKAATKTSLASAPNPSSVGQSVELTAIVTSGAPGTIDGTVTFKDGATPLATRPLTNGKATLTTTEIASGLHDVVATYDGNASFEKSSSDPISQSVTGPRCQGLKPTCGQAGNADCCASAVVPGGSYLRNYDGVVYTSASNPATVSDFRLDIYEVTVGRFRAFVQAGKGTQADPPAVDSGAHPLIAGSGWQQVFEQNLPVDDAALKVSFRCVFPQPGTYTWTDVPGANESRPMNCVSWHLAFAFCAWDGGRLATEAEWSYAAAGGSEQRVRPWSVPPDSLTVTQSYAVYSAAGVTPVGTHPLGNGKWGHADMAGNVWEWVLDGFNNTLLNPCSDCARLGGSDRVIKGGGFNFNEHDTYASRRQTAGDTFRGSDVGFRCARAP